MRPFMSFVTLAMVLSGSAVASPLKRAPTLVISLSTPASSINSVGEIALIATVENTSDQDIKVLKYATVLDSDLPTSSFTVTRGTQSVPFTGVKLQLATTDLTDDSFVTIPAGRSVTATHTNVAPLYDFHEFGAGSFTFAPEQIFQVAAADGSVSDIADTVRVIASAPSVDVFVESDVSKRELQIWDDLEKRATATCLLPTTSVQIAAGYKSFISSSYLEAKSLASIAADYIRTHGTSDPLFKAYFGATTSSNPYDVFTAVANENSPTRKLDCGDPRSLCNEPGKSVIAYTIMGGPRNVYYCPRFFNEVETSRLCNGTTVNSRNVRGGTTLHELTHALADTNDVGYGCPFDQTLASNPTEAMRNADSYNCFATQVYANTRC